MRNGISLASEGYGYHTFELKWNPSHTEFRDAKQFLKSVSAHDQFYPLGQYENGRWFCGVLCQYGIRIYMTETENKNIFKLVVNPRLLIEPGSTYLGIMPNDSESFERLECAFTDCMRSVHLPDFLEDWTLSRLDLCVNIQWIRKKGPHELLRPLADNYPIIQMDSLLNLLQNMEDDGAAFTYMRKGKKLGSVKDYAQNGLQSLGERS